LFHFSISSESSLFLQSLIPIRPGTARAMTVLLRLPRNQPYQELMIRTLFTLPLWRNDNDRNRLGITAG
jgi:hypothetical protein